MGYVRISSLLAQISAISSLTVIFPLGTVLMLFALLPRQFPIFEFRTLWFLCPETESDDDGLMD